MEKFRQKWLAKKSNLSEEKTQPEHKYSVTFVTKIGTKILIKKYEKDIATNCWGKLTDSFSFKKSPISENTVVLISIDFSDNSIVRRCRLLSSRLYSSNSSRCFVERGKRTATGMRKTQSIDCVSRRMSVNIFPCSSTFSVLLSWGYVMLSAAKSNISSWTPRNSRDTGLSPMTHPFGNSTVTKFWPFCLLILTIFPLEVTVVFSMCLVSFVASTVSVSSLISGKEQSGSWKKTK